LLPQDFRHFFNRANSLRSLRAGATSRSTSNFVPEKGLSMRLLLGLSAGLLFSLVGGAALAAPPTSVFDVGASSSAVLAPNADEAKADAGARFVLAERVPMTKGLSFGLSQLSNLRDGRRIVKLPQMHQGIPVIDRSATVTFDAAGVAHVVAAKLANDLPSDVTPTVDAATAAETASRRAGVAMPGQSGRLVIWPSGDGDHLAWSFYAPSMGLPYAPVTVVDAKTGALLAHYNAAVTVHKANVFPSNPVRSPQLTNVTLPLPTGATELTDELITAKNCVDTKMTMPIPGLPFNVHICALQKTAVADAMTLDFGDKPAADSAPQDSFSELHIYHHTRVVYDYFRAFDPTFKVQATPIDAVANLMLPAGLLAGDLQKAADPNIPFEPFQNAFFAPAAPPGQFSLQSVFGITGAAMMFGQGPIKDYAYDADVIYHEFTHAAVNATVAFVGTAHHDKYGISMSPGGMNEGIADYFATAITGDPDVGEYAVLDADPSAGSIRSLANPDACPSAIGGEVHQDATLFSGGLWDVRSKLAPEVQRDFDLAVFAAMKAAPSGDLGYEEFANIIIGQVKMAPTLGTNVATQLTNAFTGRGVLPECARILEYQGKPMAGPLNAGGGVKVWFGPSTSSANIANNKLGYVPGVVQIHVPLPANTDSLTIDFRGATAGGGGGFGGPMGSFTPKMLVRIADEPIQFTFSPFSAGDAAAVDLTDNGKDGQGLTMYTATTAIPAGAKNAYVMIVNTADADGLYADIDFSTTQSAGTGGAGGMGGAGSGGSGTGAGPVISEDTGCGCVVPGQTNAPIGFSMISLAAVAGLLARRRRS
jgi:MYXO-CTERM domain-containing protein